MRFLIVLSSVSSPGFGWCDDGQDLDNLAKPVVSALEGGEVNNLMNLAFPRDSALSKCVSEFQLDSSNNQFAAKLNEYGKLRDVSLFHESKIKDIISI